MISRIEDELDMEYKRRCKFVDFIKPSSEIELNNAIMLSKILSNMLVLHCHYDEKVENKVLSICKNISNNTCKNNF